MDRKLFKRLGHVGRMSEEQVTKIMYESDRKNKRDRGSSCFRLFCDFQKLEMALPHPPVGKEFREGMLFLNYPNVSGFQSFCMNFGIQMYV